MGSLLACQCNKGTLLATTARLSSNRCLAGCLPFPGLVSHHTENLIRPEHRNNLHAQCADLCHATECYAATHRPLQYGTAEALSQHVENAFTLTIECVLGV